ncbi:DUF1800 domain-containing protein [Pseudoroseicyclus sp. H15]
MGFNPDLAEIRFGMGLSPLVPAKQSVAEMMQAALAPDVIETLAPVTPFSEAVGILHDLRQARRDERDAPTDAGKTAARERFRASNQAAAALRRNNLAASYIRAAETDSGLRERLVGFWADHFTVRAKNGLTKHLVTPYVEEAIRPYIFGQFGRLLREAVLHPMMLDYLDQTRSAGPNSDAAEHRGAGLNENLARELMELHTLGVDGPYTQADVREMAELLAGVGWNLDEDRFTFRVGQTEPGSEVVLGQTFSPDSALSTVIEALDFLAVHPATARHISTKMARSFIADDPPEALVEAMAAAWAQSGGNLRRVTATMLRHPAAWMERRLRIKPPFDFIASSLRAFGFGRAEIGAMPINKAWAQLGLPLRAMGQSWEEPVGPDGWPDEADAWITPQFYAARISWAMQMPERLSDLPDPRDFVGTALGSLASPEMEFAAAAAETRAEGVGLVLASPDFQRR